MEKLKCADNLAGVLLFATGWGAESAGMHVAGVTAGQHMDLLRLVWDGSLFQGLLGDRGLWTDL